MRHTAQSDVGQLLRVAMKHPREAFVSQAAIDAQWRALHFMAPPDFRLACHEFDQLIRLLQDCGAEVLLLPQDERTGLDSIYARDASLILDRGAVLCQMGKALRSHEPAAQGVALARLGLPVAGAISAPGRVEGGDVTWLDSHTLAVGQGYRTNAAGLAQLRALLDDSVHDVIEVPLPHWRGTQDVMHLMSLISPVDHDLALVYSPLLPVPFRTSLLDRGLRLVEVPPEEFDTMGGNVLAVAPRTVVAVSGNPRTRAALEAEGVTVLEYEGRHISMMGSGGPTCLTRPLLRGIES